MLEALRRHLDDPEGLHLEAELLVDLHAGKSRAVPLEDFVKRYGSKL